MSARSQDGRVVKGGNKFAVEDAGLDNWIFGGRGGIRTHGTLAGTPVFKTGALNHSATLPNANLMREGVADCKRRLGPRAHEGGRPTRATIPSPRPCPPHFRRVRPAIYSYLGAEMGRIGKAAVACLA